MKFALAISALLLAMTLTRSAPARHTFEKISSQDEHFNKVLDNDHVVIGFYDSEKAPDSRDVIKNLLDDLTRAESLGNRQLHFGFADLSEIPFLRSHYDIDTDSGFFYFVKNQLQKMPNFSPQVEKTLKSPSSYAKLLQNSLDFLNQRFNRISAPLANIQELREALHDHGVIGVYIGKEDKSFATFKSFAATHIDFDFYHVFDRELGENIFKYKTTQALPDKPVLAIIRSAELVTDFDDQALVFTDRLTSARSLEKFFAYERYPKMLGDQDAESAVNRLLYHHQAMLMFVGGSDHSSENYQAFVKAVKVLPKKLVYLTIQHDSEKLGSLLQLFMMSNQSMASEKVYFVRIEGAADVSVVPLTKTVTKTNVIDFAQPFIDEIERTSRTNPDKHEHGRPQGNSAYKPDEL